MSASGSLEFAQARLQARYGARPGAADWGRIEGLRGLAAFVAAARPGPLGRWVEGLTANADCHRIDALMRAHWRALVDEVADWMPPQWGPAVRWCALLPGLPLLQHVARGGALPASMTADRDFEGLFDGDGAAVTLTAEGPDGIAAAWLQQWRRLLPHAGGDDARSLDELARLARAHWRDFAHSPGDEGSAMRRAFGARAALLFRRAALQPAAAFVFLALSALDLERLRGELTRRAAFGELKVA